MKSPLELEKVLMIEHKDGSRSYLLCLSKPGHTLQLQFDLSFEQYEKIILELHHAGILGERRVAETYNGVKPGYAVTTFQIKCHPSVLDENARLWNELDNDQIKRTNK